MKIAQINTVCKSGSVGRISLDLYTMAESTGDQSVFIYGRNSAPVNVRGYKTGNCLDMGMHVLKNFFQDQSGFGSKKQTEKLIAFLKEEKPDLLHLHNLHGFYLQVEVLFSYIKKEGLPVVWTLHDCWPFTGHCAYYDYVNCDGYRNGCRKCRYHAKLYPYALFRDDAAANFRRKQKAFLGVDRMVLVTPSSWLSGQLQQSFLKGYETKVIPNGIDLNLFFCKKNKTQSTSLKLLGVANIWEARKGLIYLEELAEEMPKDWELTIIGVSRKQKRELDKKFPKKRLKAVLRTESAEELADYYRQADVFVNPTLEDNFPTTNLEALACGTPVVTFETGGSGEMLTSSCGVVVADKSVRGLLRGIEYARSLQPEACRQQAGMYDRAKRLEEYRVLYKGLKEMDYGNEGIHCDDNISGS